MSLERGSFAITKRDWSLHQGGQEDMDRNKEKVKEAIKKNLPEIISDGSIITADPNTKKIIKVPMKSLELPRLRYGNNQGDGVGAGDGQEGDVIGKAPSKKKGQGKEGEGGDQPGVSFYEEEISYEELKQMMYEDLGLPYLDPKESERIRHEKIKFNTVIHRPKFSNIDVMRTIMENIKRNAKESGKVEMGGFNQDDIWIKDWNWEIDRESEAVVIVMADVSGSMGDFEKYIISVFTRWMLDMLEIRYSNVIVVFVAHDTNAWELTREEFFTVRSNGGTMCSSANQLAKTIIADRFPVADYNAYPLHFSDGENFSHDNEKCAALVNELLAMGISMYGYVQIGGGIFADLLKTYQTKVKHERFKALQIKDRQDVYPALKQVFSVKP